MIKVLFVCLGNICRSPMAEFIFKDIIYKRNISSEFIIESAGTSNEEYGNPLYYEAKRILDQYHIKYSSRRARQITKEDYLKYDYIIAMEEKNINEILDIIGSDKDKKIYRLLDFSNNPRDISDPWYTRYFNRAYIEIREGIVSFLKYLGY